MGAQNLAVLGGGHMGRALLGGLLRRGRRPEELAVADVDAATRARLTSDFAVRAFALAGEAIRGAALIVVAVKPQHVAALLGEIRDALREERPLVLCIAAGIRAASLREWCGPGIAIVRAMPNCAALVGAGVSALFAAPEVTAEARAAAEQVLAAVGDTLWLGREEDLDAVTALSGSGPAYFFALAEAMMQAAIELGLDPACARRLAAGTLYGAGMVAHASNGDLGALRAAVASAGGTTEAALAVFSAADLRAITRAALQAAAARSRELAGQFG